jgi:hypothetical protein
MRADLSRSQNDSTDRNTIEELKAAHRHEVAGLNSQLARLHRERDKIINDWHQLQEVVQQTRDNHELILVRLEKQHALRETNLQVRMEHDHHMKLSKVQQEHEQTVQEMLAQFSAREAQQASSTGVSRAAAPSPERGQTLTPGQRLRQEHEQQHSNIHGKPHSGMSDEYWEKEAKLREMLQSRLPDQKPKGKTTFKKIPLPSSKPHRSANGSAAAGSGTAIGAQQQAGSEMLAMAAEALRAERAKTRMELAGQDDALHLI